MSTQIDLPVFCSVESRKSKLDPSWIKLGDKVDFYLVFEFNYPWDKWVEKSNNFPTGLTEYLQNLKSEGRKFKYFCIKSENYEVWKSKDEIRIIFYKGNQTGFTSFVKTELVVPQNKFLASIKALVDGDSSNYNKYGVRQNKIRDIFICTHDERDQCCGTFGKNILEILKTKIFDDSIRIWQSSHMGGHRVGPTFMDMPSGQVWGYLEGDVIQEIILKNNNHNRVLKNYRGTFGLDRYSQIADKNIFEMKGWNWLNVDKRSEIISQTEEVINVKIIYQSDTESGEYLAAVFSNGKIILPATQCSKSVTMTKFEIKDLRQIIY